MSRNRPQRTWRYTPRPKTSDHPAGKRSGKRWDPAWTTGYIRYMDILLDYYIIKGLDSGILMVYYIHISIGISIYGLKYMDRLWDTHSILLDNNGILYRLYIYKFLDIYLYLYWITISPY